MSGRRLMILFLGFLALFAAALYYFQVFAFYVRTEAPQEVAGLPVLGWEGIDAGTSPLKLRACFATAPEAAPTLEPAPDAAPLTAPFWFRCFDARRIAEDLATGEATAHAVTRDAPEGFDLMLAVYGDGRGYLWRQLNERFR